MRKERLLKEQQRNKILENSGISLVSGANLISVDIQPEYSDYFSFEIYSFTEYLNGIFDQLNSLTFLFNGPWYLSVTVASIR